MEGLVAVVLAGGEGSRMRSSRPKAVHPLLGLPLAAWPARAALAAGARPVVVVVGDPNGDVERTLRRGGGGGDDLRFALQAAPRGTADAVVSARDATAGAEHVLIINGDVPLMRGETLRRLLEVYEASGGSLAVTTCVLPDGGAYGRALRGADGELVAIREAKDCSAEERAVREVNVGVYVARRELLFDGLARLNSDNAQGELYLTDLVEVLVGDGRRVGAFRLDGPEEMAGVNNRVELAEAARVLRGRVNRRWMLAGVSMEDPDTTWVEAGVTIGADTTLGPGVVLRGGTVVGGGCVVGAGAVLADVVVGDGAVVGAGSVLSDVRVEPGERVVARTREEAR